MLVENSTDCSGEFVSFQAPRCHIRKQQAFIFSYNFQLYACAQLWPEGQEGSLKGSLWRSSVSNHTKCGEVLLGAWSCVTRDFADWKCYWPDFTHYSKAHKKISERRGQKEWQLRSTRIDPEACLHGADHCAKNHEKEREKHYKAWKENIGAQADCTKVEDTLNDKQAAKLPSWGKEQVCLEEGFFLNWWGTKHYC